MPKRTEISVEEMGDLATICSEMHMMLSNTERQMRRNGLDVHECSSVQGAKLSLLESKRLVAAVCRYIERAIND